MNRLLLLLLTIATPATISALPDDTTEREYGEKLKTTDMRKPDSLVTLGQWCRQRKLTYEAREHFLEAIRIDANHAKARAEMGYAKKGGKWVRKPGRDYKAAAGMISIAIDPNVQSNNAWKEIVAWVNIRENWEDVLQSLDEELGIYRVITIRARILSRDSPSPAAGGGGPQGAEFYIMCPAVVTWARKDGLDIPTFLKIAVTHEITHCYQVSRNGQPLPPTQNWPMWIYEGMGDYAAAYTPRLKELAGKTVNDIDAVPGSARAPATTLEPYARGLLFYKYLAFAYGEENLRKTFIDILEMETSPKQAFQQLSGKSWDQLKAEERAWSAAFMQQRPK